MGVFDTLRSALGLQKPLRIRELPELAISANASRRLAELGDTGGLRVATRAARGGYMVQVEEGPRGAQQIDYSPEDAERMRGLTLDFDGRWRVTTRLEIRRRDTPNPNGRVFLTDRQLAESRAFFASPEGAPAWVQDLLERPDVLTVYLRENTATIERAEGASWDPIDRAVKGALQQHALLCGVALAERDVPQRESASEQAVWDFLSEYVLPAIHKDGGDLELLSIEDGVAHVRLIGACRTCPASSLTLKGSVERQLKGAFPDLIREVRAQ